MKVNFNYSQFFFARYEYLQYIALGSVMTVLPFLYERVLTSLIHPQCVDDAPWWFAEFHYFQLFACHFFLNKLNLSGDLTPLQQEPHWCSLI